VATDRLTPTTERFTPSALYRAVLLAAALVAAGLLVHELASLLLIILITVILALPLSALATRLQRHRIPRGVGAALGIVGGILVLAALVALVIPQLLKQGDELVDQLPSIIPGANGEKAQDFLQGYIDQPSKLIGPLANVGVSVAGAIGTVVLVLITAFFMAVRPRPLVDSMLRLFPPQRRDHALHVLDRLRGAWIGWLQGVGIDMLISGVLLYVALSLVGLDFALLFAVLGALLVVIPYFGAVLGALPPVLFALTESPEKAIVVLIAYLIVQQIEGNVIVPLVMSNRLKLHPAAIAIGVLVVGQLFGVIGLFVAVPLVAAAVILVDELWVRQVEAAEEVEVDVELPPAVDTPHAPAPRTAHMVPGAGGYS
jgi:predicted PurR-regulated permease PerM